MDLYPNAAGDADLTERVILEAATPVGVLFYVVDFMFLAVMSTTFYSEATHQRHQIMRSPS